MKHFDRNTFFRALREKGVSCSVLWRPLHLHPCCEQTFEWQRADLPNASREWEHLISVPQFSGMRPVEIDAVVSAVGAVAGRFSPRQLVAVW